MTDSVRVLVASGNRGKLVEYQQIFEGLPFQLLMPADLGLQLEVAETGSSYAENATLKARAYAYASGLISMSDDSGLEVDALNGAPGLYSARYDPKPGANDTDRRLYLLGELARSGATRPWFAHFHCTIAVSKPTGEVYLAEGNCPGEIISDERGTNGFGYDPIFYLSQYERTMAEISANEKNQISHRALAVRATIQLLYQIIA
jgi:XTP/dITP diphosphohydrolase